MGPDLPSIRSFMGDFIKKELDNFLHKNSETAESLHKKILSSERERKELAGIRKIVRERNKKANLHNKNCAIAVNIIIT